MIIYTHLDYSSKVASANAIMEILSKTEADSGQTQRIPVPPEKTSENPESGTASEESDAKNAEKAVLTRANATDSNPEKRGPKSVKPQ